MSVSTPLVCHDCWPTRQNWNEPCPHALEVFEQGKRAVEAGSPPQDPPVCANCGAVQLSRRGNPNWRAELGQISGLVSDIDRGAAPAPPPPDAIQRQLASVIHAARTAGPFGCSVRSDEEGLQNAKRKLLALIVGVSAFIPKPPSVGPWTVKPDKQGWAQGFKPYWEVVRDFPGADERQLGPFNSETEAIEVRDALNRLAVGPSAPTPEGDK